MRKHQGKIRRALNEQVSSFLNDMSEHGQTYALDRLVVGQQLWPVVRTVYVDVASRFAADQYRALKKQTGKSLFFSSEWAQRVIDALRTFGLNLISRINATTRDIIERVLEQGQREGWGAEKTARAIREETAIINRKRALTIARTETTRAANKGKLMGAMELGLRMRKTWITAKDMRVRPYQNGEYRAGEANHVKLQGESVPLDQPFSNGLMEPGDANGPASETVNCRCTITFEVVKDANGDPIPHTYWTLNKG